MIGRWAKPSKCVTHEKTKFSASLRFTAITIVLDFQSLSSFSLRVLKREDDVDTAPPAGGIFEACPFGIGSKYSRI